MCAKRKAIRHKIHTAAKNFPNGSYFFTLHRSPSYGNTKKQCSKRHPSLDCNAREEHLFRFFAFHVTLRTFIALSEQKKENVKLLPRDNPRESYEFIWNCQIFRVETHKAFIVRNICRAMGKISLRAGGSLDVCATNKKTFIGRLLVSSKYECSLLYSWIIIDAARDKKKYDEKSYSENIHLPL